jgi:hypothetical protein
LSVRRHVIISGTGRAGTTFLVQLFTRLGLDTGFPDLSSAMHANCNAGMEWDLRRADAPYIVKSPWLCDYLEEIVRDGEVVIDHAIVPIRDLYDAAESRRDVVRRADADAGPLDAIPGGLWHTQRPEQQERVLAHQLYKLLFALAKHDIPTSLLDFPRVVRDRNYLWEKSRFLLPGIDYPQFLRAFQDVSRPELVHDFRTRAASATRVGDTARTRSEGSG